MERVASSPTSSSRWLTNAGGEVNQRKVTRLGRMFFSEACRLGREDAIGGFHQRLVSSKGILSVPVYDGVMPVRNIVARSQDQEKGDGKEDQDFADSELCSLVGVGRRKKRD